MKQPDNINDLRNELLEAYAILRDDPKTAGQIGELANTAGKIINTVKVELEYAELRKERPHCQFLHYPERRVSAPVET